MKKILFTLIILAGSYSHAQNILSRNDLLAGTAFDNRIVGASGKTLSYDEISGSPYPDKSFRQAKIAENYEKTAVRYNSYKDEIEFKDGSDIKILPKDSHFARVEIFSPQQTLVYLTLDGESAGYYYELAGGKAAAYKKLKTNFKDVQPASTPYGSDQPATFTNASAVYFLVLNGKVLKRPKNQNQVVEFFPNLKEPINDFVKKNKIKFDKEEDLKKLVNFINEN